MKMESSVPEVVEFFKEIQQRPKKLFDMIRCERNGDIHEAWRRAHGEREKRMAQGELADSSKLKADS
jgi:hypothetical protein